MQQSGDVGVAAVLDRLIAEAIPNEIGRHAWQSLLRAHATLLRQLAMDLVDEIGLTVGDSMCWLNLVLLAESCA